MKRLLGRRGFRLLLTGQGVSALGDWMGTVAFIAVVHEVTDSSTAVGGVLVLRLIPAALAGPLSARAVARWDRKRTMLTMDVLRAGMIAAVPLVRGLWWIYLWAFLVEGASLVFLPARDASIPDLVESEDLPTANGLVLGSSYGTIPLGAALFALVAALPLLDHGGLAGRPHALVFFVDAATYLVSFAAVSRITELDPTVDPSAVPDGSPPATFRGALRLPLVRAVMPAAATAAMGLGALFSLGIVFVREVLGATDAEFGILIMLFGVGACLGLVVLRRFGNDLRTVRVAVMLQGAVVAFMSMAPSILWTFVGATGFGAACAATLAAGMSVLQDRLDGDDRVLAFAAFHVIIRGGLSIAAMAAGVAADLLDSVDWPVVGRLSSVRLVLFISGVVVMISAIPVREHDANPALGGAA